jgi:shikimate dehydrogenase
MIRLLLLGDPVEHSLSPVMHNTALAACGLQGVYQAKRVDESGMRIAAEAVRSGEVRGANITMPHKRLAYLLADRTDPEAGRARSVNTWVSDDGALVGYSTDIGGIRRVWVDRGLPDDEPVLVLGSGGAAAAALVALAGRPVWVSARRGEAADRLVGELGVEAGQVAWGTGVAGAVVVNCTPLGMRGETLPPRVLETASGLFDMAYGPQETPAVAYARSRGIPFADGVHLLAAQAEESFRIWTGVTPPRGVMEQAARRKVGKTLQEPGTGAENRV